MWINERIGYLQDWITQLWVKTTGRRLDPSKETWLTGPIGNTKVIGDAFINDLSSKDNLLIQKDGRDFGLLDGVDQLELSIDERNLLNKKIVEFYEKTSNFNFEIWSEWCGFFRPFGWLLSVIFSKRLQQLNLPLSSMDASRGIESSIIKLIEQQTKLTKWTIWHRILKNTRHVIYAGVYTTCRIPNSTGKFLKVIFPLPNGSATVIMKKEVLKDGSLKLSSDGQKFGDNGFYFTLTNHKGKYWARFVRSMHEWITVFVDEENCLRANHNLHFYGLPFLKLHYKMISKDFVSDGGIELQKVQVCDATKAK